MYFHDFVSREVSDVQSEDGQTIGEVAAVHVSEDSNLAFFVEIDDQEKNDNFIVPVWQATFEGEKLVLPYAAEDIESGPRVNPSDVMSVGEVSAVVNYYQSGAVSFEGYAITEKSDTPSDPDTTDTGFVKKHLPPVVTRFDPGMGSFQ